jgi:hypothetical protein
LARLGFITQNGVDTDIAFYGAEDYLLNFYPYFVSGAGETLKITLSGGGIRYVGLIPASATFSSFDPLYQIASSHYVIQGGVKYYLSKRSVYVTTKLSTSSTPISSQLVITNRARKPVIYGYSWSTAFTGGGGGGSGGSGAWWSIWGSGGGGGGGGRGGSGTGYWYTSNLFPFYNLPEGENIYASLTSENTTGLNTAGGAGATGDFGQSGSSGGTANQADTGTYTSISVTNGVSSTYLSVQGKLVDFSMERSTWYSTAPGTGGTCYGTDNRGGPGGYHGQWSYTGRGWVAYYIPSQAPSGTGYGGAGGAGGSSANSTPSTPDVVESDLSIVGRKETLTSILVWPLGGNGGRGGGGQIYWREPFDSNKQGQAGLSGSPPIRGKANILFEAWE